MCVNIFHEFSSTQVRKSNQRGMSECHIEKSAVEIACVGLERCHVPQRAPWTSLRTWVQLSRTHIKKPGVVVCAFTSSARQQRQGDPSDILAPQSSWVADSSFSDRPCLNRQGGAQQRKASIVNLWLQCAHTCKPTPTHTTHTPHSRKNWSHNDVRVAHMSGK